MITKEMIQKIANSVKLVFTDEEESRLAEDLSIFAKFIDTMDKLDTDGVEPMTHVHKIENVLRDDLVNDKNDREDLLKNAPKQKDRFIVVPKTVE